MALYVPAIAGAFISLSSYSLQFMTCGLESTAVPTSIHCDHLIQAITGAEEDLKVNYA